MLNPPLLIYQHLKRFQVHKDEQRRAERREELRQPLSQSKLQLYIHVNRLPHAPHLSDNVRNHFVAASGGFVGTVLFLFFAIAGTQVANNVPSTGKGNGNVIPPIEAGANPSQLLYIALSFGFSLAVNGVGLFQS